MSRISRFCLIAVASTLLLSGCGNVKKEASYPDRFKGSDKIVYSDKSRETIWGEGESLTSKLFGSDKEENGGGAGIGVNSFLWRASLDTVSFMPLASADPFGGVILTEWYENPDTPGERFKMNVYIMDKRLRADGIRVSVFKQTQKKSAWHDAKTTGKMATDIENAILTRARDLRVAQLSRNK